MIPKIDIWRAANLMLKRYGDKAPDESAARADELAAAGDYKARLCGAASAARSPSLRARHRQARYIDPVAKGGHTSPSIRLTG